MQAPASFQRYSYAGETHRWLLMSYTVGISSIDCFRRDIRKWRTSDWYWAMSYWKQEVMTSPSLPVGLCQKTCCVSVWWPMALK